MIRGVAFSPRSLEWVSVCFSLQDLLMSTSAGIPALSRACIDFIPLLLLPTPLSGKDVISDVLDVKPRLMPLACLCFGTKQLANL